MKILYIFPLVFISMVKSMSPTFNTSESYSGHFNRTYSLDYTFLVSREYYDFILKTHLPFYKIKMIDQYFAPFKMTENSQTLKFLDFHITERPQITPKILSGNSKKFETNSIKKKYSYILNRFECEKVLLHSLNLENPPQVASIVTFKLSDLDQYLGLPFNINIKENPNKHLPVPTLKFLHFIMNHIVEVNSSLVFNIPQRLHHPELLEYVIGTVHFQISTQRLSFISLLHEVCLLADKFFIFEPDNYPSDLFSKMMFLAVTLESYFFFDENASKYLAANNNTEYVSHLLDQEYDNFMMIVRDQFRGVIIQYLKTPRGEESDLVFEKFMVVYHSFKFLTDIMNLICNYFRILRREKLRVFRIDYSLLFTSVPSHNFDIHSPVGSSESGIFAVNNFYIEDLIKDLGFSIRNMLLLPIKYHHSENESQFPKSEEIIESPKLIKTTANNSTIKKFLKNIRSKFCF